MEDMSGAGCPYEVKMTAVRQGCAQCEGEIAVSPSGPAGDPFSSGPWRGRYLCGSCWTLYYSEHPEHLADKATFEFMKKEAEGIRLARATKGAELIFEEGKSRAYLTSSGTVAFQIERHEGLAMEEFDTDRFRILALAMQAVDKAAIPGFSLGAISP